MILVPCGGIRVYRSDLLDRHPEIGHGFSTRVGGVSAGPHASLNLSAATGDTRENALENRRRLCLGLGADPARVTIPRQVLGAEVRPVDDAMVGGVTPEGADGLITDRRGVPLLTLSADCVLVLLWDPVRRALANVHASRHGSLAGICTRAIEGLRRTYGTDPADLVAAVGPSIGPCCYHVREDVAQGWRARHGDRFLRPGEGGIVLDLWSATRAQLEECGLKPAQIDVAGVCTRCTPDLLFSYRRDGECTGRFGAIAWIRE